MSKHLLLVDDEPHVLRVMKMTLERVGYKITTARHGIDAFEKLQMSYPDVLITDIDMPKMNGEELCKKIDSELRDRNFRIYVATSRTELEHREWSKKIPNLVFLEKPLSARKLSTMLAEYFASSETTGNDSSC